MNAIQLEVRAVGLPVDQARAAAASSRSEASSDAFDDWARSSGPALLRFATLVTGNSTDAADAVQDALIAVYPRWRRLSDEDAQEAYARRVIINRNISRWRRIGRRERLVEAPEATTLELPDHATALSDSDAAKRLLSTLPERQRAAVMLRFYDDMSFTQIAEILGCRESTARSYVHRALLALRAQLASNQQPGHDDE